MHTILPLAQSSPWRTFFVSMILVILLFVSALFTGIYINSYRAVELELLSRAQSLFYSITLVRKWSSSYNGVYVEKTPGVISNPYLKNPDIQGADGKIYTKKNPALMTREISELAHDNEAFSFHIMSLNPLNPDNQADAYERQALKSFVAANTNEVLTKLKINGANYYRYIAPLYTKKSCLTCHPNSQEGEVRGGISVIFNIDKAEYSIKVTRYMIIISFLLTLTAFMAIVYRLVISLRNKLRVAEEQILELALTDELTGLRNRRFAIARLVDEFERSLRYKRPISCALFDLDFFKKINDTYGHDNGDKVLKAVSEASLAHCRSIDIVARYGGEEFLLLMPETDKETACFVAERIRKVIESLVVQTVDNQEIKLTASLGVSCVYPLPRMVDNTTCAAEQLIKEADIALYRAKGNGRNRVEVA
jgi:diguanylate cyclase (GGDEF)-like protein